MIYLHDSKLLLKIQFEAQSPVKNVYFLEGYHYMSPIVRLTSVGYGAGWARVSLPRPRPYNPRPAPVRGPPALMPWTGPRLLPPIFDGDPSGVWVGRGPERGQGQGMPKKTPRPRPLSGAGRGKGPAAFFRAPSAR